MARVSHDQNFKNLILDYSRHALAFFAPEEAPGPEDDVRILPGPVLAGLVPARTGTCGHLQGGRGRAPPLRTRRESQLAWPVSIFLRAGAAPATVALGTERGRYLTFDFLACRLYAMDARVEENKTMAGMIQRAHDEGMRQGRAEGIREGRADVLEQLLRRRFGPLAPAVTDRLHNGSAADLEVWTESLLDARTLDDVFDRSPLE
ncbi:MAG: DUF4351 domain-containing protein [Gammaproteobacteria bacterium]|nr:DUF4351 domain-containing protein [Gammaproteobacteria bacterium]